MCVTYTVNLRLGSGVSAQRRQLVHHHAVTTLQSVEVNVGENAANTSDGDEVRYPEVRYPETARYASAVGDVQDAIVVEPVVVKARTLSDSARV